MNPPPANPAPLIEMRGVTVGAMRDLRHVVLQDVNWSVVRGEFWVIGGLQGSGKTDLMFLAAGLMAPIEGTYEFNGQRMPIFDENRLQERLKLGMVFDGGQLLNHLTVAENIALPLRYHENLTTAEAAPEVERMLKFCGLTEFANNTPGAIGRNWQQRAGLARALMLRPEVLLVDNPLGGMDLRHRSWWLGFLGQLARGHEWFGGKPITLVATTDDLRPWANMANRVGVLKEKHLMVLGPWEVAHASEDDYVREFILPGHATI